MEQIANWAYNEFGLTPAVQTQIVSTLGAIVFLIIVRKTILIFVSRNTKDVAVHYHWRKVTTYFTFAVAVFIVATIWFRGFQSITTYLGILSAGIAIALKDPIVNLVGWVFILWRRPFSVGQRVQIGEDRGDVIDQRIFMFSILEIGNWVDAEQSTGRVIHIPNGKVFTEPIANYEEGFRYIWNELGILVTFESNWRDAKAILHEIASEHGEIFTKAAEKEIKLEAGKMMIYLSKLTPIVYTSIKDSGVMLTMRYLCDPRRRRGSEEGIWEAVLAKFGERDDIDFAYPTQRHYLNHLEGKPEARSDPPTPKSGGE